MNRAQTDLSTRIEKLRPRTQDTKLHARIDALKARLASGVEATEREIVDEFDALTRAVEPSKP